MVHVLSPGNCWIAGSHPQTDVWMHTDGKNYTICHLPLAEGGIIRCRCLWDKIIIKNLTNIYFQPKLNWFQSTMCLSWQFIHFLFILTYLINILYSCVNSCFLPWKHPIITLDMTTTYSTVVLSLYIYTIYGVQNVSRLHPTAAVVMTISPPIRSLK